MFLVILLLCVIKNEACWATESDDDFESESEGESVCWAIGDEDYADISKAEKNFTKIEDDFEESTHQIEQFLTHAYDFPERERAFLKQKVQETQLEQLQLVVQITTTYKTIFPFAPLQQIFLWHLTSGSPVISIKSFIPSLRNFSDRQLFDIHCTLRDLPDFFSRHAFNQIKNGYLEGDVSLLQKWVNVANTCRAVKKETNSMVDVRERFEVASHLMLFMQHRSIDLIPYYAEALLQDVKKIEDRYYPLYCLSRRLKGHDDLQNYLLYTLKEKYSKDFDGLFSKSAELLKIIQTKGYVATTAVMFIGQFVKQANNPESISSSKNLDYCPEMG